MIGLVLLLAASWIIAGPLLSSGSAKNTENFDANFDSAGVTIVVPAPKGAGHDAVIDAGTIEQAPAAPAAAVPPADAPLPTRRTAL